MAKARKPIDTELSAKAEVRLAHAGECFARYDTPEFERMREGLAAFREAMALLRDAGVFVGGLQSTKSGEA
jgi:hypothetical protein